MFRYVLNRKEVFLDYKNVDFVWSSNVKFCKGVNPSSIILVKNIEFFHCLFLGKLDLEKMFRVL